MNQDFTTTERGTIGAKSPLENFSRSRRFFLVSRILIVAILMATFNATHAQSYRETTGYLLQKVEPLTHYYYIPFKHGFILPYFYGYYVVDNKTLHDYFKHDSVFLEQAVMLCDPTNEMFTDSSIVKEIKRFTRIMDVLSLDDSEIYKIGHSMYIIRKIRYAYYDNTQVRVYIRNSAADMWDDISDKDTVEFNAIYEVGQLYKRDYYQCYHHLVEILPTPPQISRHVWKKLYQLGEDKK